MTAQRLPLHLGFAVASLALTLALATFAHAGECPAAQTRAGARTSGETMARNVTDTTLGAVNLAQEIQGLDGRQLRLRRLVIQPGGIVPWHTHADRPALIMTVSGSITEYRSTCAVGIEHPAGDVAHESGGISHWWRNNGRVPAVLIAADVFHNTTPAADDHM
jgi:quercetin dioxygenase-like cupin family protein